jgi:hypothetical protein
MMLVHEGDFFYQYFRMGLKGRLNRIVFFFII